MAMSNAEMFSQAQAIANGTAGDGNPIDPKHRNADAKAALEKLLDGFDLGDLSDWAWDRIVQGASAEELFLLIRDQPKFQERFPAIKMREEAGLPPLGPTEYLEWEERAYQIMRASGLPPGFYDDPSDFTELIAADISPQEFEQRITQGFQKVAQTDPNVRKAFQTYFGVQGDAALAAYFLDPDKASTILLDQAAQATVGGAAARLDFSISQAEAKRITDIGVTEAGQAQAGFRKLDEVRDVLDETVSERGQDLTAGQEGADFAFGTGSKGAAAVRQRIERRAADFEGGGGAAQTRGGTGLGSAG